MIDYLRSPFVKKIINIVTSIILLGIALYILDWETMIEVIGKLDIVILVFAIVICTSQFIFLAMRWFYLIKDSAALGFYEHFWRYLISTFVNSFTPSNIGGDVYRTISLKPYVERSSKVITMLLRERMVGLLSFLMMYTICISLYNLFSIESEGKEDDIFNLFVVFVLIGLIIIFYLPKISSLLLQLKFIKKSKSIKTTIEYIRVIFTFSSVKDFLILLGFSFVALLLWIYMIQLIAIQLDIVLAWYVIGMIAAMVELARLVPITIQGIGLRESFFAYLLSLLGQSPEAGFVLGGMGYILLSISILLSGLIGYLLSFSAVKNFIVDN